MATATVEEQAATVAAEISGGLATLEQAFGAVAIASVEDYRLYADAMLDVKKRAKLIDEREEEFLSGLREAKRQIDATMKKLKSVFDGPRTILDGIARRISNAMTAWQRDEQLKQEAEQRRRAAEAAAEQEKIRKEAEKQAKKAEKAGDTQTAEMLRTTAQQVVVSAPVVQTEVPKVAGLATRETWRGECFDLAALAMGVATGEVPSTAIQVNQTVLNQAARAAKGQFSWPGCRSICEQDIVRTGR